MIPEKIEYPYDFPLNIKIVSVDEDPLNYHQDVELVYVLKGEIRLKNGSCEYILPEGGIFTNNGKEVHGFSGTDKDNIVAIIHISNLYFTKYYPELTLSSYRTFTPKETDSRFDQLRKLALSIISLYLKKSIGHKQECIDTTIELIDFLNRNFNFFAIKDGLVVSPHYDDLVLIERMSRIIPYIYEHHSEKISLDELSEMEHLSIFYISHMIKTCTGLSFREFLCFARVEYSEMLLLDPASKVNTVAKEVGFSTTAYYEKFFKQWFGILPEEHKKKYLPVIKGSERPERMRALNINKAISVVRQNVLCINAQVGNELKTENLKCELDADPGKPVIASVHPKFQIEISLTGYKKLGDEMFTLLNRLNCESVILRYDDGDLREDLSGLKYELEEKGFRVSNTNARKSVATASCGLDSIANLVRIFRRDLLSVHPIRIKLMDDGDKDVLLKGDSGLLTSSGVRKSVYYGYLALSRMKGQLIAWNKRYAAVRVNAKTPVYVIAAFNYSETTEQLCKENVTPREVEDIINDYNDELDISANISGPAGKFVIKKYSFSKANTLFDYLAKLGFPAKYDSGFDLDLNVHTMPDTEVTTETVSGSLRLNFSLRGTGLQIAVIESIDNH
jgi:AraC-like DNA-binding protein